MKKLKKAGRSLWPPKASTVILSVTIAAFALMGLAGCLKWVEREAVLGTVGAISALAFFSIQNALEAARFRRELFLQFNANYDKLNGKLANVLANCKKASTDEAMKATDQKTLEDYFNLCGEEYYYFRKGYVDTAVWQNWLRGMHWWYTQHKRIADFWDNELSKGSYYGLTAAIIAEGQSPSEGPVAPDFG